MRDVQFINKCMIKEDALEHYRKLERMYALAPINQFYRPTLQVQEGAAVLTIPVREAFHHTAGAMHGSVYFKALDDAAFFAANSLVQDVFVLTATFELTFLRPVQSGDIRAEGKVIGHEGRRILASSTLFDAHGTKVAEGSGTFALSKISLNQEVGYL